MLTASVECKDIFYDSLVRILQAVPRKDKIILLGDFNARAGKRSHCLKGDKNQREWSATVEPLRKPYSNYHQHLVSPAK